MNVFTLLLLLFPIAIMVIQFYHVDAAKGGSFQKDYWNAKDAKIIEGQPSALSFCII